VTLFTLAGHDTPAEELAETQDMFCTPAENVSFTLGVTAVPGPALVTVTVSVIVDPTTLTLGDRAFVTDTSAVAATLSVVTGNV